MDYSVLTEKIIKLRDADLKLRDLLIQKRQLSDGYNSEMEALHIKNAEILNDIIDKIGYPSIDKVGEEASEAAWLVIQHAIGRPAFMKKCLTLLEKAVRQQEVNPINLAYLTDRIAVFEGKNQLYGTQFDWDESGELCPNPYDDIIKVNQRRRKIGLNSLEEQTITIRKQTENENQSPPANFQERQKKLNEWRKRVGWTV